MARKEKIVVDASIVTKWYSAEEGSDKAIEYMEKHIAGSIELIVPALLLYEVANALNHKPDFTEEDLQRSMDALVDLSLTVEMPSKELMKRAVSFAKASDLSVYDSCYISLAEGLNAKMVTADRRLLDKLRGYPLVSFL
jgi:predicted nucleic acid-binding protein